jgi:hypothetical protein
MSGFVSNVLVSRSLPGQRITGVGERWRLRPQVTPDESLRSIVLVSNVEETYTDSRRYRKMQRTPLVASP